MKKILVLICLLFTFQSVANAQAALLVLLFGESVASENFYFSIKAGENMSFLSGTENTKPRYGINFGLIANIKLSDKWYLAPEFTPLSPKGAKDMPYRLSGNSDLDDVLQGSNSGLRELNYIDIPLMLQYRFNKRFHISAGPQLSILTSATDIFDAKVFGDDKLVYEDNLESELNTLDYSFNFEIGYSISTARGGKGLDIGARYSMGLSDMVKNNSGSALKNSVVQLYVGFPFIIVPDEKK